MAVQHNPGADKDQFICLQLKPGKMWTGKDSGERGGKLEESRKDTVPNPEAKAKMPGLPGKKSYKGGV